MGERDDQEDQDHLAGEGRRRAGSQVDLDDDRRSRILSFGTPRPGPGRAVLIAVVSTVVFFGAIVLLVTTSSGWERFKAYFFDWGIYRDSFPEIADAFWINVKIFSIAEAIILVTALALAVLRSLPGPVFFPVRALAIVYADFFRGVPTILVILMLGVGMPALDLQGLPEDELFWATVSLVLVYTAYVSEVYRAGIESVHPSQDGAARSLGLTRSQSLRFVVIPQAVRRVIPPLLNDFIGLQKDTALVSVLGVVEALNQASINESADFNGTHYLVAATLFVAITIPLARFTDWLVARDRRRRQAGAVAA
jgi:polar amino acid transport system permease protein